MVPGRPALQPANSRWVMLMLWMCSTGVGLVPGKDIVAAARRLRITVGQGREGGVPAQRQGWERWGRRSWGGCKAVGWGAGIVLVVQGLTRRWSSWGLHAFHVVLPVCRAAVLCADQVARVCGCRCYRLSVGGLWAATGSPPLAVRPLTNAIILLMASLWQGLTLPRRLRLPVMACRPTTSQVGEGKRNPLAALIPFIPPRLHLSPSFPLYATHPDPVRYWYCSHPHCPPAARH